MIKEYTKKDSYKILNIINDAAIKYKGIIPDECWHEPYMSEQELYNEFNNGVHMFGYRSNGNLIGNQSGSFARPSYEVFHIVTFGLKQTSKAN